VYATLGTVLDEPKLLTSVLEALSTENVNLIVTVGRGRDFDQLVPRPANARICGYIPQSLLLPRCDVVVAHGGYNTIVGCIDCGVPMVLLPVRGDQVQDAEWCASAGIARALQPGHQTPSLIRDAVRDVLGNAVYRQRATSLREEMHQQRGVDYAVELLEALVG
jgi:MGT family glycosyltransferase